MEQSKKFLNYFNVTIAYVRFYEEEASNSYSIKKQEKAIRKYAEVNQHKIVKIFKETVRYSGKEYGLPELARMLDFIESNKWNKWKIKFLIVSDVTRLSSNPQILSSTKEFLRSKGITLISLDDLMPRYLEE